MSAGDRAALLARARAARHRRRDPGGRGLPARERPVPVARRRHAARLRSGRAGRAPPRASRGGDVAAARRPRAESFGSIGTDAQGCVRRIGKRFDLGGSTQAGLYTWVNVVSARALDDLPERRDLRAPRPLDRAAPGLRARDVIACWRPRRLPLGAGRNAERVPRSEPAPAAPLLPRRGSRGEAGGRALRAGARARRWRDARRGS